MKAVTAEQMRRIDRATSSDIGIPSIVLMENAAREVCKVCIRELRGIDEPKAVIFAGGLGTRLSEATNLIPKPTFKRQRHKLSNSVSL